MLKNAFTGVLCYVEFGLCLATFIPVMAVSSQLHKDDPTQRLPGRWMRRLGRATGRMSPLWTFSVEGEPPADVARAPYVVVANHESTADPFLLSWLPWDMRYVAKEELFHQPFTGWAFRFSGDIKLRRGHGESVREMMAECERSLAAGISVMVFPEGTRSKSGELLPFKDGAFHLAIKAGVPVLPVAIAGTRQMRPKDSKWFGKARAGAKVLPALSTKGLTEADVPRLREAARDAIAATLPDLRARYADAPRA
jgi:1-acyl-sn-glycerol-3-phosphate acyltransferase